MSSEGVDLKKRRFLTASTAVVGAVGVGFVAVPFIASWMPSERAKALGAPEEADISNLEPGALLRLKWRGKVTWVVRRTEQNLADLAGLDGLAGRSEFGRRDPAAAVLQERDPVDQARICRAGRYLHPPGLLADLPPGSGPGRSRARLEGWFFLCLPWFDIRSRRACLQWRPGADQPGGAAAPVPV